MVCYQYWPPTITEIEVISEFNIKLHKETLYDGYNERIIVITNNMVNGYTFKIYIYNIYIILLLFYYTIAELQILFLYIQSGEKQTVTQYQITNWDANGHMNNIQTILTVLEDVYKVQRKMGNTPIIVHCR